jgi:coenzyme F420 hydrogenase subunit beta
LHHLHASLPAVPALGAEADEHLFGRVRTPEEQAGTYHDTLLTTATRPDVHDAGHDGGLVSAILMWARDEGYIDGALVSYLEGDGSTWKAVAGVAATGEQILGSAGSRYTYSADMLAIDEAFERGLNKLALVGMSCQSSVSPLMWHRKVGKISKPIIFNIGLLCSKTFDDVIFEELFEAKCGLKKQESRS